MRGGGRRGLLISRGGGGGERRRRPYLPLPFGHLLLPLSSSSLSDSITAPRRLPSLSLSLSFLPFPFSSNGRPPGDSPICGGGESREPPVSVYPRTELLEAFGFSGKQERKHMTIILIISIMSKLIGIT